MAEMIGVVAVKVDRYGLLCVAREVRLVRIDNPPCGHDDCRDQLMLSGPVAYGLTRDGTGHKALRRLASSRIREDKDARDLAASESLGG